MTPEYYMYIIHDRRDSKRYISPHPKGATNHICHLPSKYISTILIINKFNLNLYSLNIKLILKKFIILFIVFLKLFFLFIYIYVY